LAADGASEAAATADGGSLADEEAVTVAGFADNKFLKALTLIPARCAEEPFLSAKICSLLDYFLTLVFALSSSSLADHARASTEEADLFVQPCISHNHRTTIRQRLMMLHEVYAHLWNLTVQLNKS
jgi:hypothetical protein